MKDDFYIGWQDKAPASYAHIRCLFFGSVLIASIAVVAIYTSSQEPFSDSYIRQMGMLEEHTGTIVTEPVYGLRTNENGHVKTIPLTGFGKFSAKPVIDFLKKQTDGHLKNYEITLRGTEFTYADKFWMELTEGNRSILSIRPLGAMPSRSIHYKGEITLRGEIVDPKCFFGLMKPAYKAIHRSCAIRCISGGIPPVLAIRENGKFTDYYFLTDKSDHSLSKEVLAWVGVPVEIKGELKQFDDWESIQLSEETLLGDSSGMALASGSIAICR